MMAPGIMFFGPPKEQFREHIDVETGYLRKSPPAVPPTPPAIALADTLSRGVTLSLPQAWRTTSLEAVNALPRVNH